MEAVARPLVGRHVATEVAAGCTLGEYVADHIVKLVVGVGDVRVSMGYLFHAGGDLLALLVIAVLNVYTPQELTPYVWRNQHQQRPVS